MLCTRGFPQHPGVSFPAACAGCVRYCRTLQPRSAPLTRHRHPCCPFALQNDSIESLLARKAVQPHIFPATLVLKPWCGALPATSTLDPRP